MLTIICKANAFDEMSLKASAQPPTFAQNVDLTAGRTYQTFGIGVFEDEYLALVVEDSDTPRWLPVQFFASLNAATPADWRIVVEAGHSDENSRLPDGWRFVAGESALLEDIVRFESLILAESWAVKWFRDHFDLD